MNDSTRLESSDGVALVELLKARIRAHIEPFERDGARLDKIDAGLQRCCPAEYAALGVDLEFLSEAMDEALIQLDFEAMSEDQQQTFGLLVGVRGGLSEKTQEQLRELTRRLMEKNPAPMQAHRPWMPSTALLAMLELMHCIGEAPGWVLDSLMVGADADAARDFRGMVSTIRGFGAPKEPDHD